MCLIIHKPANTTFHETWLRDFHKRNRDGYGIMYAEGGKLYVHKSLGNADRFVQAFSARASKELLIHLRMRTHGDIDLFNCHPYEVLKSDEGGVFGAIWMMHNGVLSFGNDADKKKSDTWHYIHNVLQPLLRRTPALLFDETFQRLVSRDIGSTNKFTFMASSGQVVILNKAGGQMWNDAWMSNTYAWSASDAKIPGLHTGYSHGNGYGYEYSGGSYNRNTYNRGVTYVAKMNAHDFLQILRSEDLDLAWQKLNFPEVNRAIAADYEGMVELATLIEEGAFTPKTEDERFVVDWVNKLGDARLTEAEKEKMCLEVDKRIEDAAQAAAARNNIEEEVALGAVAAEAATAITVAASGTVSGHVLGSDAAINARLWCEKYCVSGCQLPNGCSKGDVRDTMTNAAPLSLPQHEPLPDSVVMPSEAEVEAASAAQESIDEQASSIAEAAVLFGVADAVTERKESEAS